MIAKTIRYVVAPMGWLCVVTLGVAIGAPVDDGELRVTDSSRSILSRQRILVAVTDDDFLDNKLPIWCVTQLEKALEACRAERNATSIVLEPIRAGSPANLRGGRVTSSGPRRLIGCIADGERRLLGFFIGVPSPRQLLSLSEDADEVAVALALSELTEIKSDDDVDTEHESAIQRMVRDRAMNRVIRHYRPLLESILSTKSVDNNAGLLANALAADIRERFLFDSPTEIHRWVSTQQHAEARRYWCDAMLPSLVGTNVNEIWPELAASVWGAEPWRRRESLQQMATWCSETLQRHPVVLQLESDRRLLDAETFSVNAARPTEVTTERDEKVASFMNDEVSRVCDLAGLAVVLEELQYPPQKVRLENPDSVRYVVLESIGQAPRLLPYAAQSRVLEIVKRIRP